MVPDVGLGDREQDVAHQLPLRRPFGHCHVQIGRRHVGNILDYQRQQRHKAADKEKSHLLSLVQAEPGKGQRHEDNNRDVSAHQRKRTEKRSDGRKRSHVNAQGYRDDSGQREAGRNAQERDEGAANQALLEMQDRERVQDFHRGGKNQRREEALLYGRAASRKPPGREQQCHETNGKPEGFRFRQFLPNTELAESNHERQ